MAKAEKTKSPERRQPNRVQRYMRESMGELKKVNWPTRQEAINLTIIVLIVTFSMSILLGSLDYLFARIIDLILSLS